VQSEDLLSSKKRVVKQAIAAKDEILQLEESLKKQVEEAQKQVSRSTNRTTEILNEHETMRKEFERRKQELNHLHKQVESQPALLD
jgi:peptidoglycan hydrolase CwlO-like protein